jgi:hypothetical protein
VFVSAFAFYFFLLFNCYFVLSFVIAFCFVLGFHFSL